ncbi:MAG: hypothetical protein GYB67_03325 [Chloroflexi bacterium]|nr:hypothetical protein [Chloroflexota bacterium]
MMSTLTAPAPNEASGPITAIEPLSPREARLERAARVLRWAAISNVLLALLTGVGVLLAAAQVDPGVFPTLHDVFLSRYVGASDLALALVILLLFLNMSALLVVMVGVLAREIWAIPALWLLVLLNVSGVVALGFAFGAVTAIAAVWAGVITGRDLQAFRFNPVMLKELRGRMRGVRAFAVMSVYLTLMSTFAMLLYLIYNSIGRGTGSAAAGELGRVLFVGVVGIELLLIVFIAPAFTAGAITGERERQTYDLLRTTLLTSPSFVTGKLESALGYILLLLLAGIPLQSIAFLFGGVSEVEVLLSFVILMITAITLGTIGIYFSAVMAKTLRASVRSYSVILGVMFIVPVVLSVIISLVRDILFVQLNVLLSPALEALLDYTEALLTALNPVTTALRTQELLVNQQIVGFWRATLSSDGSTIPMVSPWITFAIIYLTVSALLIVLAIRRTRAVEV